MTSRREPPAARFDLIPPGAVRRLAQLFDRDARTFGPRDWENGSIPLSGFVNMAQDALNRLHARDTSDDHAARAVWAMIGYMHVEALVRVGRLPEGLADLPAPDPILLPGSPPVPPAFLSAPAAPSNGEKKNLPPTPPPSFLLPPGSRSDEGGT